MTLTEQNLSKKKKKTLVNWSLDYLSPSYLNYLSELRLVLWRPKILLIPRYMNGSNFELAPYNCSLDGSAVNHPSTYVEQYRFISVTSVKLAEQQVSTPEPLSDFGITNFCDIKECNSAKFMGFSNIWKSNRYFKNFPCFHPWIIFWF